MKINTSSVSTPEFWVRGGSTRVENERHLWSRNDLHTRWCAVQNKEITLKAGFFCAICHAKRVATCLQISQPFHELKLVKFLAFHILTWSLEKVPFTDGAFPFRPLREARSRDPRTPKGKGFKATNLSAQIQVQWLCEKRRQQSTYVDHKRHYGDGLLRKNKQTNKSNLMKLQWFKPKIKGQNWIKFFSALCSRFNRTRNVYLGTFTTFVMHL